MYFKKKKGSTFYFLRQMVCCNFPWNKLKEMVILLKDVQHLLYVQSTQ